MIDVRQFTIDQLKELVLHSYEESSGGNCAMCTYFNSYECTFSQCPLVTETGIEILRNLE